MNEEDYGTDIDNSWSLNSQGDLKTVYGYGNAEQAIINRLRTIPGELWEFEYENYNGNKSYWVLGDTDVRLAVEKIKIYMEEVLLSEPRVKKIEQLQISYKDKVIGVDVTLILVSDDTRNLVFKIGEV